MQNHTNELLCSFSFGKDPYELDNIQNFINNQRLVSNYEVESVKKPEINDNNCNQLFSFKNYKNYSPEGNLFSGYFGQQSKLIQNCLRSNFSTSFLHFDNANTENSITNKNTSNVFMKTIKTQIYTKESKEYCDSSFTNLLHSVNLHPKNKAKSKSLHYAFQRITIY